MFWLEYETNHHEQIESKIKAPKNLIDLSTLIFIYLYFFNNTQIEQSRKKKKKTHV